MGEKPQTAKTAINTSWVCVLSSPTNHPIKRIIESSPTTKAKMLQDKENETKDMGLALIMTEQYLSELI